MTAPPAWPFWSVATGVAALALAAGAQGEAPAPHEWTLPEARAQWRPMVRPIEHVGVPGYQFQTAVMWDGGLVFGPLGFRELKVMQAEIAPLGDSLLHVSVGFGEPMRFVDRHGTRRPGVARGLDEGRLPIPHVVTRDGALSWDETVFAHLLGRGREAFMEPREGDVLVTEALFRVRNTGDSPAVGHLWLHFGDTSEVWLGYKAGMGAELAPAIKHRYEAPYGWLGGSVRYILPAPSAGVVRFHASVPPPDGMTRAGERVLEWAVPLGAGEERELRLAIPYGCVGDDVARRILEVDAGRALEEMRHAWRELLAAPGEIRTPEPFLNDYLAAVAGQMAEQVAYREKTKVWMYKTSPNHYEGYWPCNAAEALPALDLRGLTRVSGPVLHSFVETQTGDVGALPAQRGGGGGNVKGEGFEARPGFLGNFGEWTANTLLISHGLEIWALSAHYRTTRDRAWLGDGPGSPLQAIVDGCEWVATQRARTMREENGKKVAHWGLLPAASAHDWYSGNAIFNDAYCIYGMTEAVRLLREIGHPKAGAIAREVVDYRRCLHDRYVEARDRAKTIPMPDGSFLPFVPRDVYELDWRSPDWTYTGYGPVRAGAMGALDPNDELVSQSLEFLEVGQPRGDGRYLKAHIANADIADSNWADVSDPEAARHQIWRHYVEYETMWPVGWHLFLARDDLPRFFEWLFNNLAVVIHDEFRVGVESLDGVPSCAPGDGERWQAVRAMFVNEWGGWDGSQQDLWLLQAIPRSWLAPGAKLGVRQMGTRFGGTVDVSLSAADDGASATADIRLAMVETPGKVRVRMRSGTGRPLSSATVNGAAAPVETGDVIALPSQPSGHYTIVARFAG